MNVRRFGLLIVLTSACVAMTGCAQSGPRMTLKSPSGLMRDLAFGGDGLTKARYGGSDHARDWAMQEEAARRQQQMTPPATGHASL